MTMFLIVCRSFIYLFDLFLVLVLGVCIFYFIPFCFIPPFIWFYALLVDHSCTCLEFYLRPALHTFDLSTLDCMDGHELSSMYAYYM